MKRFYKFLMPLVALVVLALPWNVQAQCDNGTITVANSETQTTTTSYFPAYSYYNYSVSEVLVPAEALEGLGEIHSMQFKPTNTTSSNYYNNCEVYLANSTLTDLSGGWVQDTSLHLVFTGSLNFTTTDWQTITFDTAFAYNGNSLIVLVRRNHGSYSSSGSFAAYNPGVVLGRYIYQDGGAYTIGSISGGNTTSSAVPLYKFTGCYEPILCARVKDLYASAIDSNEITINWLDTLNSGASYTVTYWSGANDTNSVTVTDTFVTVTGLNAVTLYHFEVVPNCSDGSTNNPASASFTTSCGVVATPYSNTFEGLSTGAMPDCWMQVATGTSGSGTFPSAYNHSPNARNGSIYFEFESSTGQTEIAALPQMENISSLALTFYASLMNYNFVLEVGVLEGTTFVVVDTVDLIVGSGGNWHGSYNPYTVYFANYSGSGNRIAMRVTASGSYTLMMDDFSIEEFSGCFPLSHVTATNIDSSSITLHWVDQGNSGATYTVIYWSNANDTTFDYAYDTTITFTGLNANTLYNFAIFADCGGGNSDTTYASFRTDCGTSPIPFTEGFEALAANVAPTCWTVLGGSPSVFSNTTHTGSHCLRFSGSYTNAIALPPLSQPTGTLQVRFWVRPESYTSNYPGTFSVGYMADINVDSTWVELANWSYNEFSDYEEKEVPMVGAPDTARIVLRQNANSTNWYWFVDDLVVEPIPTCAHPISVSAANVTANSADISILGIGDGFRIYWNDGVATDSVDVTDTVYTLTGLSGSTNYTISVATLCADGSVTSSVSTSIRTDCEFGGCDVVINMVDSYGDGWNGHAINGYSNGVAVFNATLSSGNNATYTYRTCNGDTLFLSWVSGSYPSEVSFTVSLGGMQMVAGGGSDYSNGDTVLHVVGCPSCTAPTDFTVDSVTSSSATFHWTAGGFETEWEVTFNGTTTVVTNESYSVSGLDANTQYNVVVRAICGTDDTSFALNGSLQTECGTVTVPYMTDFEGLSTGSLPDCWRAFQTGTSGSGTFPSAYNYAQNAFNGNVYFEFESTSGQTEVVALPVMDNINTLMLTFHASLMNNNFTLEVGVMEGNTFVTVDTVSLIVGSGGNWHGSYNEYEVPLNNYTGTGDRIALRVTSSGSYTLMIDDFNVSVYTGCSRPAEPVVTNVSNDQIDISFSGSQSGDYYLYITDGGSYTDSVSVMGDSSYTFTGLTQLTTYTISVHADCGSGLSLPRIVTATTTMVAAPLPYSTGFESGDDAAWMTLNGTQTNQWFMGSATGNSSSNSLYITNDGGVSNNYNISATSSVTVYKVFTFDSAAVYSISFDWNANGETSYDYLRAFLVPATVTLNANSDNGIGNSGTPAGWIALDNGSRLNQATSWQTQVTDVNITTTGNYMMVFYWRNDNTSGTQPPAAIDNIQIGILSCPIPDNLNASAITGTSATIGWTPLGSESQWEVEFNGSRQIVNTPVYLASGLTNLTNYSVRVRAICGSGDTSFFSDAYTFRTEMCDAATTALSYESSMSASTSSYSPIGYSLYNYSYVQTIIDSAFLTNLGGDINALAFYPTTTTAGNYFTNMTIYMANVSEDDLSNGFILPDANHTFVKVVDSTDLSYTTTGEQIVSFDSVFTWDGYSNILVAVKRDHGSWSSGATFSAHTASASKMRYVYQDSGPYDYTSVTGGTVSATVGDIKLISCGGSSCPAPAVANVAASYNAATVTVNGNGNGFELRYGTDPSTLGNPMTITNNVFNITGLTPNTQYFFSVVQLCDSGVVSNPTSGIFTTSDLPCFPVSNITVSAVTYDGATISWTAGGNETNWEVMAYNTVDTVTATCTSTTYTVTGLTSDVAYNVNVRPLCGSAGDFPGDWADTPASFTTKKCQPVTGVTVVEVTNTTATISWTAATEGTGTYRLEYGPNGMAQGQGTSVTATTNSYTIEGLEPDLTYDVYVANICSENLISAWSSVTSFQTTNGEGIANIDAEGNLSIYPNPASSMVTLTVAEMLSGAEVTIVDLNGRTVMTFSLQGTTATFDVSQLSQGAYFVRLTGEQATTVRKLIVK